MLYLSSFSEWPLALPCCGLPLVECGRRALLSALSVAKRSSASLQPCPGMSLTLSLVRLHLEVDPMAFLENGVEDK